jgi:hypothetical protein
VTVKPKIKKETDDDSCEGGYAVGKIYVHISSCWKKGNYDTVV